MIPELVIQLIIVGAMGLLIGSFLNVVIYRLPIMSYTSRASYNLFLPRSFCPHCNTPIRISDNIPILSYLLLKRKCRACTKPIAYRYVVVEALTCLVCVLVTWHFGALCPKTAAALVLTCVLITLSFIDVEHSILPDAITLPSLWAGLLLSLWNVFETPTACILGAVAGYLSLWTVYQSFKYLTGKEGMGYGDFKLLAMLGAWLGWQSIPLIVFIASILGSLVGIYLMFFKGNHRDTPIPFGPYLAMGGLVALLWQSELTRFYLNFLL